MLTEKGFWIGSSSSDSGYNTMETDAIRNITDGGAFINPWTGKGSCSVTMNNRIGKEGFMFEYRITKYNPIFRVNGIYTRDDWTCVCDIGKEYNGCTLTTDECVTVLSNYVNCIMEIVAAAGVTEFAVSDVEVYNTKYKREFRLRNGEVVAQQRLRYIIMGCLEEKVWCRLSNKNAYIHFEYDLYVYVGCELEYSSIEHICSKYGLFGELFKES